jgi:hypothetical protein
MGGQHLLNPSCVQSSTNLGSRAQSRSRIGYRGTFDRSRRRLWRALNEPSPLPRLELAVGQRMMRSHRGKLSSLREGVSQVKWRAGKGSAREDRAHASATGTPTEGLDNGRESEVSEMQAMIWGSGASFSRWRPRRDCQIDMVQFGCQFGDSRRSVGI